MCSTVAGVSSPFNMMRHPANASPSAIAKPKPPVDPVKTASRPCKGIAGIAAESLIAAASAPLLIVGDGCRPAAGAYSAGIERRMIAQQILNGLVFGSVYALFALGFTLIFGVHHILNMAHGAVFMWGAFVGL